MIDQVKLCTQLKNTHPSLQAVKILRNGYSQGSLLSSRRCLTTKGAVNSGKMKAILIMRLGYIIIASKANATDETAAEKHTFVQ